MKRCFVREMRLAHPSATGSFPPKTSGQNSRTDLDMAVATREGATAIVVFGESGGYLWIRALLESLVFRTEDSEGTEVGMK